MKTYFALVKCFQGLIDDVELYRMGINAEAAFYRFTGFVYKETNADTHPETATLFIEGKYGDTKIMIAEVKDDKAL